MNLKCLFFCKIDDMPAWTGNNYTVLQKWREKREGEKFLFFQMGEKCQKSALQIAQDIKEQGNGRICNATEENDGVIVQKMVQYTQSHCDSSTIICFLGEIRELQTSFSKEWSARTAGTRNSSRQKICSFETIRECEESLEIHEESENTDKTSSAKKPNSGSNTRTESTRTRIASAHPKKARQKSRNSSHTPSAQGNPNNGPESRDENKKKQNRDYQNKSTNQKKESTVSQNEPMDFTDEDPLDQDSPFGSSRNGSRSESDGTPKDSEATSMAENEEESDTADPQEKPGSSDAWTSDTTSPQQNDGQKNNIEELKASIEQEVAKEKGMKGAAYLAFWEDKFYQKIKTNIPSFKRQLSDDLLARLIVSYDYADFCDSWKTSHPNVSLCGLTGKEYESIKKNYGMPYLQLCSIVKAEEEIK